MRMCIQYTKQRETTQQKSKLQKCMKLNKESYRLLAVTPMKR